MSGSKEGSMDQARFDELNRKRYLDGLTDEEADELGRLMAEREGKPYQSAEEFHEEHDVEDDADAARRQLRQAG
jgi:hypothetical protein